MKGCLAALLSTLVLVFSASAGEEPRARAEEGPSKEEEARKDLLKIQGTWNLEKLQEDGKLAAKADLADRTIFIGSEVFLLRQGEKILQAGTLRLTAGRTPHPINAVVRSGKNEGVTMLGLYELKGDTLTLCFDPSGDARPKAFDAPSGSGRILATYKRIRPADQTVEIVGLYKCESFGTGGRKLTSSAEVQRHGDAYLIRWTMAGAPAYVGVGIRKANTLSVAWGNRGTVGVSVYEISKGPKLIGTYTEVGGIGIIGKEQLLPAAKRLDIWTPVPAPHRPGLVD